MSRVFEGGEGVVREGTEERSRERGLLVALVCGVDVSDKGGDAFEAIMLIRRRGDVKNRVVFQVGNEYLYILLKL